MDPLLGPVNLGGWIEPSRMLRAAGALKRGRYIEAGAKLRRVDWVIVGGESGPRARPMHPQWARDLRDQCVAASVPFLFKQHGCWSEVPAADGRLGDVWLLPHGPVPWIQDDGQWYTAPLMRRMDKHAAGRLLDEHLHDDKPATWR
jgi:hypothetical protein